MGVAKRMEVLPVSLAPIGLPRLIAAAFVGMSPNKFDELVADGRMPKPKLADGLKLWDREELVAAFKALPDDGGGGPRGTGTGNRWD